MSIISPVEKEKQDGVVADLGRNPQGFVRATWHRAVIRMIVFLLSLPIFFLTGTVVYITHFDDRVYPGVYIGERAIGGLTRSGLKSFLVDYNLFLRDTGFTVTLRTSSGTDQFRLPLAEQGSTSTPAASLDIDNTVDRALAVGRPDAWLGRIIEPWRLLFSYRTTTAAVLFNTDEIYHIFKSTVAPFEQEPKNARILISDTVPLLFTVTADVSGKLVQHIEIFEAIQSRMSVLSRSSIGGRLVPVEAAITTEKATLFTKQLPMIFGQGAITLVYPHMTKPRGGEYSWVITEEQIADWFGLVLSGDGSISAYLEERPLRQYIEAIVRPDVDQPALDAKFSVENNRVKEFQPAQSGLTLDVTTTIQSIEDAVAARAVNFASSTAVPITVSQVSSTIGLAELNALGIVEVVGAGSSTFKDSHSNRIKNIANAVKRLNGVLIAPGEEFSTNKYAGPYIEANGFLPEMVIKGNQILPEVGGGMCQIGTTIFRAAMNAGMPITQRQNHSLVVSYYADPVNRNPGTDATLYEPTLDLKFVNDTGNYLLLATDIDYKRQTLNFTLWGKSDGRRGEYTHPIVKRWIEPGPAQEIVSPTAAPGSRKCQNAFRGAEATFTYTRFTSTSERIDRVFDSYYRPLPKICMIGAAAPETFVGAENAVPANSPNPTDPVIDTIAPVVH
jgi:vancomycin resistance protein YoaR